VIFDCAREGEPCTCVGQIRIGYELDWSLWQESKSTTLCSRESFSGVPTSLSEVICQCETESSYVENLRFGSEICPFMYEKIKTSAECHTAAQALGYAFKEPVLETSEQLCTVCNSCGYDSGTATMLELVGDVDYILCQAPSYAIEIAQMISTSAPETTVDPQPYRRMEKFERQICGGGQNINQWDDGTDANYGNFITDPNSSDYSGTVEECVDTCKNRTECAAVSYKREDLECGYWKMNDTTPPIDPIRGNVFVGSAATFSETIKWDCYMKITFEDPLPEEEEFDYTDPTQYDAGTLAMVVIGSMVGLAVICVFVANYFCDVTCCSKMNKFNLNSNLSSDGVVIENKNYKPSTARTNKRPKLLPGLDIGRPDTLDKTVKSYGDNPERAQIKQYYNNLKQEQAQYGQQDSWDQDNQTWNQNEISQNKVDPNWNGGEYYGQQSNENYDQQYYNGNGASNQNYEQNNQKWDEYGQQNEYGNDQQNQYGNQWDNNYDDGYNQINQNNQYGDEGNAGNAQTWGQNYNQDNNYNQNYNNYDDNGGYNNSEQNWGNYDDQQYNDYGNDQQGGYGYEEKGPPPPPAKKKFGGRPSPFVMANMKQNGERIL